MLRYLLLAVVLPAVFAIDFSACPGGLPSLTTVSVAGCAAAPCHVSNGDTITVTMTFNSGISAATLTNEVSATAFGVTTELPLSPPNDSACTTGASCPVTAGQTITVTVSLTLVTDAHDGIPFVIEYRAVDGAAVAACGSADFIVD